MPGTEMGIGGGGGGVGGGNGMFLWDLLGVCFSGNLQMGMLKRKLKYNSKLKRGI